jgi:ABC-2 type transport system ATP-binding protein
MEIAEELCDDICMINRSRKVLDGKLREVRRSFGRNAVAVKVTGGESVLNDPALVAKLEPKHEELHVLLAPAVNSQMLLRSLLDHGAIVTKFEEVETRLHDIFITKVKEGTDDYDKQEEAA